MKTRIRKERTQNRLPKVKDTKTLKAEERQADKENNEEVRKRLSNKRKKR